MLKKSISLLLAVMVLAGMFSSFSAGAAEKDTLTDSAPVKSITLKADNNIATYLDEDGNEVDITENSAQRRMRTALPSSFDLRDSGRSTSVKDQGEQGFCWSFASNACIESNLITKGLADNTIDLSETGNSWFLCTDTQDTTSPIYGDYLDGIGKGEMGGIAEYTADSLSSGFGAFPEELMKYEDFERGYPDALRFYSDFRLKEHTVLPYDIDVIKHKLIENGAIYCSYNSFNDNYYYTKDGMQSYYDNGTSIDGDEPYGSHAVTIIGWDDNFSKDNFNPELNVKNDGAWLCKNSWGENYQSKTAAGYEGYFFISYDCNIHNVSQFEMQDVDSFDNIYQHQATGEVYLSDSESGMFTVANVFTANADETLEQICFSNINKTTANVKIYKLDENYTSPTDGELLSEFTTNVDFSGTHCVDCPDDIALNKGDIFSVVISAKGLITKFRSADYWESDTEGKSYFAANDNQWHDCADDEDVSYAAVKAYTKSNSVDTTKLSDLIEQAKKLEPANEYEQGIASEVKSLINQTEKILNDKNATSNDINNAYCILKSKVDTMENYSFAINNEEDFCTFYNGFADGTMNSLYVELNTDIDFSNIYAYSSNRAFHGTFNGNGHTIKNFKAVDRNGSTAFFDTLDGAVIKDITFDNAFVSGGFNASVFAIEAKDTQFINCTVTNSKIQALEGVYATGISAITTNCTFTDCTVENSTAVGGYCAYLFFHPFGTSSTLVDCKANDYTLMSYSYVSDNLGFECTYDAINDDGCPAITVTDDSCTYEKFVGEIVSAKLNGEELKSENGVYHFEKTNGTISPYLTFAEIEPVSVGCVFDLTTKTASATLYLGTDSEIVIPSEIHDIPVVSLEKEFRCQNIDNCEIESITIPGTIKTIPDECFTEFDGLQKLVLNDGIEVIGNRAFMDCSQLSEINIPDSVRKIGDAAFYNCNANSVTLGKNIESIGRYAFGYTSDDFAMYKIEDFTIHGYTGTAAQDYAEENGFTFIPLD